MRTKVFCFILFICFSSSIFICYSQNVTNNLSFEDTISFTNDSSLFLTLKGEVVNKKIDRQSPPTNQTILGKLWEEVWQFLFGLISGILIIILSGNISYRKKVIDDGIIPIKQLMFKIQYILNIWNHKKQIDRISLDLSDWAAAYSIVDFYFDSIEELSLINQLDEHLTPLILNIDSTKTKSENYSINRDNIIKVIELTKSHLFYMKVLEDCMKLPISKTRLKKIFMKRINKRNGKQ